VDTPENSNRYREIVGMKIFISSSRNDKEIAEKIIRALEAENYDVWIDRRNIDPSQNFTEEIEQAIQNANLVLVLLSSNTSRDTSFVRREIQYASLMNKTILPVKIESQAKIPISVAGLTWIDISENISEGIEALLLRIKGLNSLFSVSIQNRADSHSRAYLNAARNILRVNEPLDRIFIAYSRSQHILARELYDLLTNKGKAVFYDAKIKAGATWRQTIQKALDDATHLVVIWTPEAAESDEVEREVSYALAERKVIVPILSKEIPKLPYHLHGLHYIILEDDLKTIEADLLKAIAQFSKDEDIWQ
jgi:predicted nucleotide-binding protein